MTYNVEIMLFSAKFSSIDTTTNTLKGNINLT